MLTAEQLAYRGGDPWNYFDKENVVQKFINHRRHHIDMRQAAGQEPLWTPEMEMSLVNEIHLVHYGEPYVAISWTEPELNVDALPVRPVNRRPLPAFKLPYQKLDEIQLRLNKTMITVKGNPFYIRSIKQAHGDFYLNMVDCDGKAWRSKYKDIPDLRSPPPLFITHEGATGWLQRIPERVYQQGLNRSNTIIRGLHSDGLVANFHPEKMCKTLASRTTRKWDNSLASLMQETAVKAVRLSDSVAAGRHGSHLMAYYKGRTLGAIKDDEVLLQDEDDLLQDWIVKDARDAGFRLRAA